LGRKIIDEVHGPGFAIGEKVIMVHISRIRTKISGTRLSILTKRGVGYRAVLEPKS
jgi:DNA-binding response OmpR family regulator